MVDLHPNLVSPHDMGNVFEELIRRFSEQSNETAGEHFTPREVIKLMVDLLFQEDGASSAQDGIVRTLYDPACGTGGMLSVAEEYLHELNDRCPPGSLRPGAQPGILRHLQGRHDHQRQQRRQHQVRQLVHQ